MIDGLETGPPLPRPTAARLLEGVLTLGRELHLEMDERTLGERFLGTLLDLYPGRLLAIRLMDEAGSIDVVGAPGVTLAPWARAAPLVVKPRSVDKTRLDPALVVAGRVRVEVTGEPAIAAAASGFTIPLVAGGAIYGALDVGYPRPARVDDEPTLIPIANHLSVALRNVRLHAEARLLRDTVGKLIDHADALIFGLDRERRFTVFNRTLARLTGRHPPHAIGRHVGELLPRAERRRLLEAVEDAFAGRAVAPIDVEFDDAQGRLVRTVWNLAAVGEGSAVEAVVAVGQDLTRLASLERQVIQAEKLATLGQLAAGVVHELNNPLTSITVYADYLSRKLERAAPGGPNPFDGADGEKLRRILEGAERILSFARTLVQYARPSSEELDVVPLNDVVRQALSLCEHIIGPRVTLDLRLDETLAPVLGLRGQLIQVVINLVTNAVQALPPAGGHLRVTTTWRGELVAMRVEDSGAGIRAEDRERIFEPFFTTKTDGKGSGLGLSIVRSIVDRHHGGIDVDSLPGRGSTFTVTLPAKR